MAGVEVVVEAGVFDRLRRCDPLFLVVLATTVVHAGVLRAGETGVVKVTILPGRRAYRGTLGQGGVKRFDWLTPWDGSFRVERWGK